LKDGKSGFVDKTGKVVVAPHWDEARNYADGMALVSTKGKRGFIDTGGRVVVPPLWDGAWDCTDGMALVSKVGKCGFIDKGGKVVVAPQWDATFFFKCRELEWRDPSGLGKLWLESKLYSDVRDRGYRPEETESVTQTEKLLQFFSNGLAPVGKDDKWGFIDRSGNIVVPIQWDGAQPFSDVLAPVRKDGKWGFIDRSGNIVVPIQWNGAQSFSDGLAAVKNSEKWGFIDRTGAVVIPVEYDKPAHFFDGLARVTKGGNLAIIDKVGRALVPKELNGHIKDASWDGDAVYLIWAARSPPEGFEEVLIAVER
jgi:hypothetical protein